MLYFGAFKSSLLISLISNKKNVPITDEICRFLDIRYCWVPLYTLTASTFFSPYQLALPHPLLLARFLCPIIPTSSGLSSSTRVQISSRRRRRRREILSSALAGIAKYIFRVEGSPSPQTSLYTRAGLICIILVRASE